MKYTTNHNLIREWVEAWGGNPVIKTGHGGPKDLRIEINWGANDPDITPIRWVDFFEWFEAKRLAFGYPADDDVDPRYCEFAKREDVELIAIKDEEIEDLRHRGDPFYSRKEWRYDKPHRD